MFLDKNMVGLFIFKKGSELKESESNGFIDVSCGERKITQSTINGESFHYLDVARSGIITYFYNRIHGSMYTPNSIGTSYFFKNAGKLEEEIGLSQALMDGPFLRVEKPEEFRKNVALPLEIISAVKAMSQYCKSNDDSGKLSNYSKFLDNVLETQSRLKEKEIVFNKEDIEQEFVAVKLNESNKKAEGANEIELSPLKKYMENKRKKNKSKISIQESETDVEDGNDSWDDCW